MNNILLIFIPEGGAKYFHAPWAFVPSFFIKAFRNVILGGKKALNNMPFLAGFS
ncbi:hypothetical protein [Endozoicomonas sp. ONNA2]|uniref:hypothetical protein n=1 Tax=Endozoicomonas sp. ONNA2 TaxID=2828741 RepID=UPI0021498CA6|nr:hypothetical protein [Endozoicomonas sp. ONNA2]